MAKIADLIVFECLKVHKIKVEPKRVISVYTLEKANNETVSNEFIYSYKENFFDVKNAGDINLASVMAAQAAINYGLFCKKIVFDGLYDEADKRFIKDMTENTSREIFVNKFLMPNEFLSPPFDKIEPEQKHKYTGAEIIFENNDYQNTVLKKESSKPDSEKFVILSSGGKDSLLSYGILNELYETHPVFINESGRHWFTAYNSYLYFKEHEPNTVKPWCNSDRIFNWMVKQMPFIKSNFQDIRADIYPIRLWTVAIFLFGVLPVARKRNIRNIIIGNEYDTTLKLNYNGITHYAALYDQSKYFDNALTRYYKKKGWGFYQFSILRSLSELLILKTLVKRYPELQEHQISCHASHKENDIMKPCGKCEKCRRIVGMLKVLDENPERCGYDEAKISKCLKALETKKVKQIGSDAQHLFYLLNTKGIINSNSEIKKMAKPNPQIMGLRFDNERSMLSDLPVEIRKKLFDILKLYAVGSYKLQNRKWVQFDFNEVDTDIPYFLSEE
ncbi:MAG: hypothetical protein JEY94_07130 [Melioribacteraceae bacterium]|nr:hypothetical protein [Melioribacteraceae bacterium]